MLLRGTASRRLVALSVVQVIENGSNRSAPPTQLLYSSTSARSLLPATYACRLCAQLYPFALLT